MSYILEALKQAEEERGSDRLSKVLSAPPVEDAQQSMVDWKKWLTIAIFINAVVLFVWVAWKFFAITGENTVHNESVQPEATFSANAPAAVEQPTGIVSSINATAIAEETVSAITKPVTPNVHAVDSEPSVTTNPLKVPASNVAATETPQSQPVKVAKTAVAPVPEEKILPSNIATSEMGNPRSLPVDSEKTLVDATPSLPVTKSAKSVQTPPVIRAEISTPKVAPLPATPREQLAIEAERELVKAEPEVVEPEVVEPEVVEPEIIEPEVVEQIAAVQRPPVPEFAELPYSLQQQIPEISISVHIFNSEPQQRKVRINGKIYREGDEVARNLWVEEITPRGVIFDYDQTVFRQNLH